MRCVCNTYSQAVRARQRENQEIYVNRPLENLITTVNADRHGQEQDEKKSHVPGTGQSIRN